MLELIFVFGISVAAVGYLVVSTRNKVQQPGCCGQNCNCHENKSS
jgi:hypothetical protein